MHLYIYIRAIRHDLHRFLSDLEAQYFNYTFKNAKGEKVNGAIQLSVREWGGFYELAFPETSFNEVMSMLFPFTTYGKKFELGLMFLRKCLGLKKVKEFKLGPQRTTWKTSHEDIRVVLIGIKKDKYDSDGVELI